jgi:predicted trehalose synthase
VSVVDFEAERWYADRGRRPRALEAMDALGDLEIVRVEFDEGEPALYTLLRGEPRWEEILAAAHGAFVFEGDPPHGAGSRLDVDQSHTSWRVGDALVKCYRRLVPGLHPEVELGRALTVELPEHVAAVRGALHWLPQGGPPVALAVVQEFVDDAQEGWEWAAARAVRGDAGFARTTGVVARRLHEALARAFPGRESTPDDRAAWRVAAEAQLEQALGLVAEEVARAVPRIRSELAQLESGPPVRLTRVHGDLHLGQFLHARGRNVVVDFEGLPGRSPAERRALDTPLRDLASLARSVDHCGRYAVERHGGRPTHVEAWIEEARSELLAGYGPHDEGLLRALEFDRAVYEFTYASRYLPDWLYAPRAALAALLRT